MILILVLMRESPVIFVFVFVLFHENNTGGNSRLLVFFIALSFVWKWTAVFRYCIWSSLFLYNRINLKLSNLIHKMSQLSKLFYLLINVYFAVEKEVSILEWLSDWSCSSESHCLLLVRGVKNVLPTSSNVTAVSALTRGGSVMVTQTAMTHQTRPTVVSTHFAYNVLLV